MPGMAVGGIDALHTVTDPVTELRGADPDSVTVSAGRFVSPFRTPKS